MSLIKIAGRHRIFSPLGIEAKLIKTYSLWDSKMKNFTLINKRPEYAYIIITIELMFLGINMFLTRAQAAMVKMSSEKGQKHTYTQEHQLL